MNLYEQLLQDSPIVSNSAKRVAKRLDTLAQIAQTPEGGANRLAYSPADRSAKEQLKIWLKEIGLQVAEDEVGNIFGRLDGKHNHLPTVMVGSHLDTVPNGGHFDGVLGVISALEILQQWRQDNFRPNRSIELVSFADEEGVRFQTNLIGSHFFTGSWEYEKFASLIDQNEDSFLNVLAKDGLSFSQKSQITRPKKEIECYIELHIEQGKVLESIHLPLGIVNGIAGLCWLKVTFSGEAGHAGSTPMKNRRDALSAAAEAIHMIEKLPTQISDTAVATVGQLLLKPGSINVIPAQVQFTIDIRDINIKNQRMLKTKIWKQLEQIAAERNIIVQIEETRFVSPTPMHPKINQLIEDVMDQLQHTPVYLPSGAGHDAMVMGKYFPTGMIFVRCKNGMSHHPGEWVSLSDIMSGIQVLDNVLRRLVQS
ncbi:allantoate deiminase [Seinonella peptonophila]|uniref:Allantoate deiminase n=1 Tax=Seinonella peptonophila TaxID=112248 RepID=A0A1M4TIT6_9BACL|nr:M20 family metallo-hydrolase [Seinonella peptonophila]SHE44422.1 allantoate deiminase [Seinonella peptonophila]